jgi:serine/threonine protein kinase/Flp pilus assembly protein TadD
MPNKNLSQVETVFHAVLELPAGERAAYLAQECTGDESLYAEVSSLISALDSQDGFMEQPALNLGLNVLSRSSEHSMIGKSVGPYKVILRLGKGGMGEVYLADDTRLGRKVALKFLSQEFIGDNWAKRQLVKEAQAVAMLDHPNICPVYGIEEHQGHSFIVMQYVEGETLSHVIHAQRSTPTEVLALAKQIIGALAESHAHGIIHRDIKPKNIMVTRSRQVKVLDFGLAKTIQQKKGIEIDDSTSRLSQNGVLVGTVAYMSPEQLRGERLDYRSDIFSLGTVLYELIEYQSPFTRPSEAETISAILTSEPEPLKNLDVESAHLAPIIHKCLQKARDERYHSASELLLELDNYPDARARQSRSRHLAPWLVTTTAVLLLAVGLALAYLRLSQSRSSNSLAANNERSKSIWVTHSLAVLPVVNKSGDNQVEYLCEGFTESLINKFALLSSLRVSPYTSVSGYKNATANPQAIGQELGADAILLEEIVPGRGSLVLRSRLIRTVDGSQIWTGEQPINWPGIFELEDQLAKTVTEGLELGLENEKNFLTTHGTSSPEAFRQYMLGRYFWRNRDKENINKAIGFFKEAIRLDPLYARAYAGLADSYVLLSTVSFGKTPTSEAMTRASAAAKEALSIDDNLAEAHTSLGVVNLRYDWDWRNAESQFRRAIELKPDYAPAHYWYSHLLLITGRRSEAISESSKARDLDPFSPPSVVNFCRILSISRQYGNAITCYDKLVKENPDNDHIKYLLALVYERSGRNEDALKMLERIYAKNPALAGAALGFVYAKVGRKDEAKQVLADMFHLARQRYVPPWEFSIIYVGLGDYDNAFVWLEKAYEERFATLIYLTVEPLFESLRFDARYASLVTRLKLPPPSP